jgi:hypothetical protein
LKQFDEAIREMSAAMRMYTTPSDVEECRQYIAQYEAGKGHRCARGRALPFCNSCGAEAKATAQTAEEDQKRKRTETVALALTVPPLRSVLARRPKPQRSISGALRPSLRG